MSKILIIGASPLPFENQKKIYGPCLRTWHFTKPLLEDGHEICLLAYRMSGTYFDEDSLDNIIKKEVTSGLTYYSLKKHIFEDIKILQGFYEEFNPDCIIGVNTSPSSFAVRIKTNKPIWADLCGHIMAEAQAKAFVYDDDLYLSHFWQFEKLAIERADIFSTVSFPQKYALIGELGCIGRLNKSTFGYEFVHVIPIAIDDSKEYVHTKNVLRGKLVNNDDFIVLWSGGYNTWTDVDTLFEGLIGAMSQSKAIKFVSTGGAIDGHDEITYYRFIKRVKSSEFSDRFIFAGWVPTEDVPNYYFESNIGINIDKFNYETILGARNRINDMLKAGLPVLTTKGTEISYVVEENKLGMTFPIGDAQGLTETILFFTHHPDLLKQYSINAKKYVFENLTYSNTTKFLREWVKEPKSAPDFGKKICLGLPPPASIKIKNLLKEFNVVSKNLGFVEANKRAAKWFYKKLKAIL